jgi:hypothetical protein
MDVSNYYYKLLNLNNNATKQDVINALTKFMSIKKEKEVELSMYM